MPRPESGRAPASLYRVQLHGGFDFAAAATLAPYFSELGISHLYLSPIFTAVPGSQHGYDVTDYGEINPELGGAGGFRRLAAALHARDGGVVLDFVPNHMGIAGMVNRWWRDVLEFGPASRFAPFFDIQWRAEAGEDHPRVLLPLLADHYGRLLERGEIQLVHEGGFFLRYGDTSLPMRPESGDALLAATGDAPDQLPLAALLRRLNGEAGQPGSFDELHALIERQHYRLARWQAGTHEINYRRFFAIDTLVGLRMENPAVFAECHALLGRLLAAGEVDGLRIDHIDGLRQPEDYLRRLQALERPDPSRPLYVLVEKILAGGEALPATWPVQGATGYEFIAQLAGALVDGGREGELDGAYRRFTGEERGYADLVVRSKRMIIAEMFANAIEHLGADLAHIVARDRLWRDFTRHELTAAIGELVSHLPVYRTYRSGSEAVSAPDGAVLEAACAAAIAADPRADPDPLVFLRDLLIGRYPPAAAAEAYRARLLGWVLTFQQYTGAIMAKAVEDTVFYQYHRFVAANEVGGDPGRLGGSLEEFHLANERRAAECPLALLATSTHDSKMSEDVRARLYALAELSGEWAGWLHDWRGRTARHLTLAEEGTAPDATDQYRFFQVLLGAWPLAGAEADAALRERLKQHLRKAVSEAKRHTSILNQNEAYLAACDRWVDGVLTDRGFLEAFLPCAHWLARLGMVNSLAQLVLKCTVPGVPDFYQGNEVWDFSLVDPDNRRPVDYGWRRRLLARVAEAPLPALLEAWRDGGIKLRVTRDLLRLRRSRPRLFAAGSYRAVPARGSFGAHVISFLRTEGADALLVVVPRLTAKIGSPPVAGVWDDTELCSFALGATADRPRGRAAAGPSAEASAKAGWRDVLTGREFPGGAPLPLRALLAELPFAVLRNWPASP